MEKYLAKFGTEWVERRGEGAEEEVRLKPLEEFRAKFEEEGEFLLVQAEEITDYFVNPVNNFMYTSNQQLMVTFPSFSDQQHRRKLPTSGRIPASFCLPATWRLLSCRCRAGPRI